MGEIGRHMLDGTLPDWLLYFFLWELLSTGFFSAGYVQLYLFTYLSGFCFLFVRPYCVFVTAAFKKKKKKEWIYSVCIVLSKSFLFQCSYYSFSPSWPLYWDFLPFRQGSLGCFACWLDSTHDWAGAFDFYNSCSQQEESGEIETLPEMYS